MTSLTLGGYCVNKVQQGEFKMSLSTGTLYYSPVVHLSIHLSGKCLRDISSYPYFLKKVRNGCCFISLPFTGSYSMCVNTLLFCAGMSLWEKWPKGG